MMGFPSVPLVVCFALAFIFVPLADAQSNFCGRALSFEACVDHDDCQVGDPNLPNFLCLGRDSLEDLVACPNSDVKVCACVPRQALHFCDSHDDCPNNMYCGQSPRSETAQICVGCASIDDTAINFTAIAPVSESRCPTVRPPCGGSFDWCAPNFPCLNSLSCIAFSGGSLFDCIDSAVPCQCSGSVSTGQTQISAQECNSIEECTNDRDTCALDVRTGSTYCVSCDAIKQGRFQTYLNGDSSKCDALTESRDAPQHYYSSANGRNFDLCTGDYLCTNGRTCVEFDDLAKNPEQRKFIPCTGLDSLCFCLQPELAKCNKATDCQIGESCITSESLKANKTCVTNALTQSLSNDVYTVEGNETRNNPDGKGLTNEVCRFDWNCKAPRRCTHVRDRWGGCAGRGACTCLPLTTPECTSDTECDEGEVCQKFIDGKDTPVCASRKVLIEAPNTFISVNFTPPAATPIANSNGLTDDGCLFTDECVGDRVCMHQNEVIGVGECEGRNFCFCRPPQLEQCNATVDCTTPGEICTGFKGDGPKQVRTCASLDSYRLDTTGFRLQFGKESPTPTPSTSLIPPSMSPTASPSPSFVASQTPGLDDFEDGPVDSTPAVMDMSDVPTSQPDPSEEAAEQSAEATNESEAVCVDSALLHHLDMKELVYKSHRRASVLCDSSGSCATATHFVVFHGQAMTMRTYCAVDAVGGCSKSVRTVNSPRMGYGVRVRSRTQGLVMTAHAARFETWAEESLLAKLIEHGGI